MTDEVKQNIEQQSRTQATPATILTSLRLSGNDSEDPLFKSKNIYNARAAIRRRALSSLTPIQALMKFLNQAEYYLQYEKNEADQITRLFFSKESSQQILSVNHEVLLMNCTYKTNKYRLPLLVICGVTAINTTFYVAFCFLSSEYTEDYVWMLRQLRGLYENLHIPPPKVAVTDREQALISALWVVYPEVTLVLCLWHVQKSVLKNCKPYFATEEQWICFQQAFNGIIFAANQEDFDTAWNHLQNTYSESHPDAALYISDTWWHYRTKYVKFWTNQVTHFNNNTTSRVEGGHRTLKRSLQFSTGRS